MVITVAIIHILITLISKPHTCLHDNKREKKKYIFSSSRYLDLVFPGLLQHTDAFAQLLEALGREGVSVENAVLSSPAAAHEDKQRLHDLVRRQLRCKFSA